VIHKKSGPFLEHELHRITEFTYPFPIWWTRPGRGHHNSYSLLGWASNPPPSS